MAFAIHRVDVDVNGNRGERVREVSPVFDNRSEATEYLERLAGAFEHNGVNDEQGHWWVRHPDGRKSLYFVEGLSPDEQGTE